MVGSQRWLAEANEAGGNLSFITVTSLVFNFSFPLSHCQRRDEMAKRRTTKLESQALSFATLNPLPSPHRQENSWKKMFVVSSLEATFVFVKINRSPQENPFSSSRVVCSSSYLEIHRYRSFALFLYLYSLRSPAQRSAAMPSNVKNEGKKLIRRWIQRILILFSSNQTH